MNWEAIGAIGEIIGAAAVVLTLAYLAMQVRAGARNTAMDARQRVLDRFSDARAHIIHSDFSTTVFQKVTGGVDEISEGEMAKLYPVMAIFADNLYNAIRLNEEGVLDDEAFDYIAGAFVQACATPIGNRWWAMFVDDAPGTLKKFVGPRLEGVASRETRDTV